VLWRRYVRIFGRRRALIQPHFAAYRVDAVSKPVLYRVSRTTASYLQSALSKKDGNPYLRIFYIITIIIIIIIVIIVIVAIFVN